MPSISRMPGTLCISKACCAIRRKKSAEAGSVQCLGLWAPACAAHLATPAYLPRRHHSALSYNRICPYFRRELECYAAGDLTSDVPEDLALSRAPIHCHCWFSARSTTDFCTTGGFCGWSNSVMYVTSATSGVTNRRWGAMLKQIFMCKQIISPNEVKPTRLRTGVYLPRFLFRKDLVLRPRQSNGMGYQGKPGLSPWRAPNLGVFIKKSSRASSRASSLEAWRVV